MNIKIYPLLLSDSNVTCIFSINIRKILKFQISWKSIQWEQRCPCGRTDRKTNMVKLIAEFRNITKRAEKLHANFHAFQSLTAVQPTVQWVPGLSRGVKSGRGVTLSPHPLLAPWSRKGRAIPLLPLWAVRPVQSLSARTGVHFTFTYHFTFTGLQSPNTECH